MIKKILISLVCIAAFNNVYAKKDSTSFVTHCTITTYKGADGSKTKDETVISNRKIKNGQQRIVAISRDLLWAIPLGSIIEVEGHGRYEVRDTTAAGINHTVDILIHKNDGQYKEEKIKIKLIKKGENNPQLFFD